MIKYFSPIMISVIQCVSIHAFPLQKISRQPNVVIIFMDDMGYGDLESYGAIGYQTLHTNKMAAEGIRFTNFYAAQAVCSASRAALLTGCYPNRIGISGALSAFSPIALNPEEETIAEILKKEGSPAGAGARTSWQHLARV